jgi:riboflavin transporter FmnP
VTDNVRGRRVDSVSLAGMAIFGALAVVLTIISQALVLDFPIVPYLQFDFGEIAILLAFFIFGPIPALVASFIEFGTLMAIGNNVAAFGPELKIIAILSSLLGIWLGTVIVRRMQRRTVGSAIALGGAIGMVLRAAIMTIPNYILIIYLYTVPGIVGFVASAFKLIGVTLTDANALLFVLLLTALFNVLQLGFVTGVTYFLMRLPQIQTMKAAGRSLWIISYLQGNR